MKRSIKASERLRQVLGVLVFGGVLVIALHLDTGVLSRLSQGNTVSLEQSLLNRFHASTPPSPAEVPSSQANRADASLTVEGRLPPLDGAVEWINSPKLTAEGLRGKVVVIDFWTYSCINCLRSLPYVKAWAEKYKGQGLVVIGIHTPEFAFEKDLGNVRKAVQELGVTYPVAIDNDFAIWRAFGNQYWPAHYFIDGQGRIRHHHFGEGDYAESESVIRKLLTENGAAVHGGTNVTVRSKGVEAAASGGDVKSNETYIGYERAENFANPGGFFRDQSHHYRAVPLTSLNGWTLNGDWVVERERAVSKSSNARIAFRFHARDLHLVLGPIANDKPIRFRVRLDGKRPGEDHGIDVDANGEGAVTGERLFQLVRQQGGIKDRIFEIEFLDPGVAAFSFTFG